MIKKLIINTLKFLVAAGLIYWLVTSGKLNMSFIKRVFIEDPWRIFFAAAFILGDQIFVAIRLRIIVLTKAIEVISTAKLFIINWIGLFFNSVLPGAVTGDLVKIFYIRDLDTSLTKNFIFLGVFMDRLIGLIGLISIGSFFSLINYSSLVELSDEVKYLVHLNFLLFLSVFIFGVLFVFFGEFPLRVSKRLQAFPVFNKVMPIFDHVWKTFTLFRDKLLPLFLCSVVVQFLAVLIFWYLVHPYAEGGVLSFTQTASIMPIGFISLALPIAPAGLGVGHAVFESLLGFYGITNGANLFNLYFVVVMICNISGALPYILYSAKKKVDLSQIKEVDEIKAN